MVFPENVIECAFRRNRAILRFPHLVVDMYVLLVYERVSRVCKHLRRYPSWVQNSLFEGELSEAKLEAMKLELKASIDESSDSVLLYVSREQLWLDKQLTGVERNPTDSLI